MCILLVKLLQLNRRMKERHLQKPKLDISCCAVYKHGNHIKDVAESPGLHCVSTPNPITVEGFDVCSGGC